MKFFGLIGLVCFIITTQFHTEAKNPITEFELSLNLQQIKKGV